MAQSTPTIQGNALEAVRYKLEKDGYAEVMLHADGFTNASTVVATIDGKSLGTSFPVPPSSFVTCTIVGAVYMADANGTTDTGAGVNFTCAGIRIGTGNVADVEGVNTALEINELAIEMNSTDGATANTITITAAADTSNQGIDITFQNDSDDENCYFVGRATLVAARDGGFAVEYAG